MGSVVDVLIKIRRVGAEEIRKTAQELKNLGASGGNNPLQNIEKSVLGIEKTIVSVSKTIKTTIGAILRDTSLKVQSEAQGFSAGLKRFAGATITAGLAINGLLVQDIFPSLSQIAGMLSAYFLPNINAIKVALASARLDVLGVLNLAFQLVTNMTGLVLRAGIMRAALTAVVEIGKRALGIGVENYTILERVSRVVVTIERSLFSSNRYGIQLAQALGWGALTVFNAMSGMMPWFLTLFPMVNSLLGVFGRLLLVQRLSFMANVMGNASAQIQLIFLTARQILARVLPLIMKYLPRLEQFLKTYLAGLPKVEGSLVRCARMVGGMVSSLLKITGGGILSALKLLSSPIRGITEFQSMKKSGTLQTTTNYKSVAEQTAKTGYQTIAKLVAQEFSETAIRTLVKRVFSVIYKGSQAEFDELFSKTAVDLRLLFNRIRAVVQAEAIKTPKALAKVVLQGLFQASSADKKAITGDFEKIFGSIAETLKKSGKKIPEQVGTGIKSNLNAMTDGFKKAANDGMDYLPQSPAKKGAFRNLIKSGVKIPEQIAAGMKKGKDAVQRAAGAVAELIAKFFPRSPALLGPLVYLVSMGAKIPFYLGLGIVKGAIHVVKAVGNLVSRVVSGIKELGKKFQDYAKRFAELGKMAERTSLSAPQTTALDYAFRTVGESITGLEFVLQRLNNSLAQGFSDEELSKIAQLGINFERVKNSANPTLEMLYELSDVLKNNAVNSRQYQLALEMLQQTVGSKLVTVLAKGRDGITGLMMEGVRAGAVISDSTAGLAQRFTELMNRLGILKERYLNWALEVFLPDLVSFLDSIFESSLVNSNKIKAYVLFIYGAVKEIAKFAAIIALDLIKNPATGLAKIKVGLQGIIDFGYSMITANMDWIFAKIKTFITVAVRFLFESSISMLEFIMPAVWNGIAPTLNRLFDFLMRIAQQFGKIIWAVVTGGTKEAIDDMVMEAKLHELMVENAAKAATKTRREEAALMREVRKFEARTGRVATVADARELQSKIDSGEITVEASYFEELVDKFNDAMKNASESFNFEEAKKNALEKFEEVFSGLLSPEAEKAAKEQWGRVMAAFDTENIAKIEEEILRLDEVLADSATNMETAAGKNKQALTNAFSGIPQIVRDASTAVEIAFQQLAKKIAEGGAKIAGFEPGKLEMLEFEKRQQEELRAFQKLQQDKLNILRGYIKDAAKLQAEEQKAALQQQEFNAMQLLEREQFIAKQRTEQTAAQTKEFAEAWLKTIAVVQSSLGNLGTMFDDLYEMSKESIKEFFYASKAVAIAQTIMNTAQAVMNALATNPGPLGIAMAATAASMGTVQVAKIVGQTLGFEQGGFVSQGSGNGDDVPALLSRGEFVLNAAAVRNLGVEYVSRLNRGIKVPRFNTGGLVGAMPISAKGGEQAAPIINIANLTDPSAVAQYFASSAGKRAFVNIIRNNSAEVRRALG